MVGPYRMRPQASVAALLRRAMRGSRCWSSVIPQHVNYSLVVGGYVAVVVDLGGERSCRAGRSQPGHFGSVALFLHRHRERLSGSWLRSSSLFCFSGRSVRVVVH